MKRKVTIMLLAVLAVISLTACEDESFICGLCGEEKTGTKYTSSIEEDMTICKDCVDMVNDLMNGLQ